MPKVLVTAVVPSAHLALLKGVAEITIGGEGEALMPRDRMLAAAPGFDAIINHGEVRVDAELLDRCPRLRIVANAAIGYDNLDGSLMASRGVWGTNAPDAFTDATADATFGLLLGVVRKIALGDRYVRAGKWTGMRLDAWEGILLRGRTLGLVGYGKIGQAVALRAKAFGMRVIYHRASPSTTPEPDRRDLDTLLAQSDVVSLHVPLTATTKHLINAERLAKIKPGAILVNMARGKVVDEEAMVAALLSGRLGGAGLDVFEHEPKVHDTLKTLDQVVLAPHLGGATADSRFDARTLCCKNVAAVLRGERPLTPINEAKR
ncbi:MAG: D-glycerate dehydrogenase [Planctomycetota bacterium]|nr:D-glycerate dehydrogenase [Planctomycetota bacterium]